MDETRSGDVSNPALDDLSFGAWLKHLREARKVTLEEIAAVTKIHISQLRHLEGDQQEKLPAPAFIRGFLTSYARHLKIDEDQVLERFSKTRKDKEKNNPLIVPIGSRAAQSTTFPKVRVVTSPTFGQAPGAKDLEQKKTPKITLKGSLWAAGAIAVIASLATVVTLGKRYRQEQTNPPVSAPMTSDTSVAPPTNTAAVPPPAPTPTAPVAAKTSAAPEAAEPGTPTIAKKNALEIRALEQSWINVRLDDGESKGFPIKGGKSYTFTVGAIGGGGGMLNGVTAEISLYYRSGQGIPYMKCASPTTPRATGM